MILPSHLSSMFSISSIQYQLHNTAVFQPSAEKHNDVIAHQFKIRRYFFGTKLQLVSTSSYSGKLSTRTNQVYPKNILGNSLDQVGSQQSQHFL